MIPLVYLDFEIRRDYIAEVLCVKKDEPITVCGGQCFLNNQLEQARQQQESNDEKTTHRYTVDLYSYHDPLPVISNKSIPFNVSFFTVNEALYLNLFVNQIFHPPQA